MNRPRLPRYLEANIYRQKYIPVGQLRGERDEGFAITARLFL